MTGVINDILKEVAAAADKLENKLNDHVFDLAVKNPLLVSSVITF